MLTVQLLSLCECIMPALWEGAQGHEDRCVAPRCMGPCWKVTFSNKQPEDINRQVQNWL